MGVPDSRGRQRLNKTDNEKHEELLGSKKHKMLYRKYNIPTEAATGVVL